MEFAMNYNPVLLSIADLCIEAIKQNEVIDLDDMWRGRGFVFFNGLAEACNRFDFQDDPSCLWDINRLASGSQGRDKLWQYLANLPGFFDGEPTALVAYSQHFWLLEKFSQVISTAIDEHKHKALRK